MFNKKKTRLKHKDVRSYFMHVKYHLKHAFIPHIHNNHYPHALRTHALVTYGVFLIALKIGITSILFLSFPDAAKLSIEQIESIFSLTNEARTENQLEPLNIHPYLTQVAEEKANDMSKKMYFSHYTPEGYAPWYFIDEQQYNYEIAGENLAMNFVEMNSVQRAFMASPGHRENILHPGFRDVGYAIASAEIDGTKTQILVEYFGTEKKLPSTFKALALADDIPNKPEQPLDTEQSDNSVVAGALSEEPVVSEEVSASDESFQFPDELIVFPSTVSEKNFALTLYDFTHKLFIFFLAFLVISLFINIIIKIRVQHGRLLLQSSLLIVLVAAIILTRIHFLEDINVSLQIY